MSHQETVFFFLVEAVFPSVGASFTNLDLIAASWRIRTDNLLQYLAFATSDSQ